MDNKAYKDELNQTGDSFNKVMVSDKLNARVSDRRNSGKICTKCKRVTYNSGYLCVKCSEKDSQDF